MYTMNMSEDTTIRISKELRKKLLELGSMSDTYESVIQKLYDDYKKHNKRKGDR